MVWREGDPVARLLETCKDNSVDLLLLGARRRENVLRYYLGSVARGLSRAAKCSLLLLTEPRSSGSAITKIVVNGVANPKTIHTMNTAVYLARELGGRCCLPEGLAQEPDEVPFVRVSQAIETALTAGEPLVCVMAAGIVVRCLCPHLRGKAVDPPVVVVDEAGQFVPPLWRRAWPIAAAALIVSAMAVGLFSILQPAPAPAPIVTRFPLVLPADQAMSRTNSQAIAVSPDGARICREPPVVPA